MSDPDDLRDRMKAAAGLPAGAPEALKRRLRGMAAGPAAPRRPWWLAAAAGAAAGILAAFLIPSPVPVAAWIREGAAPGKARPEGSWRTLSKGETVACAGWRELRLPDGTVIDAAPGARLALLDPRPGTVARLEHGLAMFSVPPGKGALAVEVPEGRIEVPGTAFAVSVNDKEGARMKTRDWLVGGCSAALAVAVTSGVVRFTSADSAAPSREVRAGQQLLLDQEGEARLKAVGEREQALAAREQALACNQAMLAGRQKALADQAAAMKVAPGAPQASPEEDLKALLDNPAFLEIMQAETREAVRDAYAGLFGQWKLAEEVQEAVEGILAAQQAESQQGWQLMMDPNVTDEAVVRRGEAADARARLELAKHLSNPQIEELEAYRKEMPKRMMAQGIDQQLAPLGLADPVRDQVRQIILEEQQASNPLGEGLSVQAVHEFRTAGQGTALDAQNAKSVADKKAENARVVARAGGLMTPGQAKAFQDRLDQQVKMMESGIAMMKAMQGK